MKSLRRLSGFTLVELMVVVTIVGILAAIAIPNYNEYVMKARRAAAQSFIAELATKQSQYFLNVRSYGTLSSTENSLNVTIPSDVSQHYTVTMTPDTTATPPTYTIAAVPVVGGSQVSDGTLQLLSNGQRIGNW